MITSRDTGRWVIPKGGVDHGHTPAQAAEIEGFEEAGIKVDILSQLGVRAAALNSSLAWSEKTKIKVALRTGKLDLLYVAPERLLMPDFLEVLQETEIAVIAISSLARSFLSAIAVREWKSFAPSNSADIRAYFQRYALI